MSILQVEQLVKTFGRRRVVDGRVRVSVTLGFPASGLLDSLRATLLARLHEHAELTDAELALDRGVVNLGSGLTLQYVVLGLERIGVLQPKLTDSHVVAEPQRL